MQALYTRTVGRLLLERLRTSINGHHDYITDYITVPAPEPDDLGDGAATERLLFSVRNPVALPGPTPPTTFVVFDYGPAAKDEELTVFCTLSNAGCKADPVSNLVTASMSAGQTGMCVPF